MNNQLHQETLIKVFYWYILPLQIKLVPQKGWMRAKVKQSYNKLIMSALLCVKKIKYLTACFNLRIGSISFRNKHYIFILKYKQCFNFFFFLISLKNSKVMTTFGLYKSPLNEELCTKLQDNIQIISPIHLALFST